jgi:hypothetical protein
MKIHVEILDDTDKIVAEHTADASQPSVWNSPGGKPLVGKMPQNSGNENNGTYELFRITFAPSVRVLRPNGWQEPPPSPLTGQPGLPANFPSLLGGPRPATYQTQTWSTVPFAPTQATQATYKLDNTGLSPAQRG